MMVYVRKLLGGESSSVACWRADINERVGDRRAFNICFSDSPKVQRGKKYGVSETDRVTGQMLREADLTFMCVCPAWGRVNLCICVSSQEAASHEWQVIGQIKAEF